MCVITLTKKDSTLFDVTSIQEEDIMEIYVWLGHTHPLGVLHYTMVESIILFQSADNMEHARCRAIKAMVLHNEPIAVGAATLSEAHVWAYMTMMGGEEPHSVTDNSHSGGETLHCLQAERGNLEDHELHQLLEDLCWEVTLHELNAPPEALHQCLGETHQGAGILMSMTGRSPFQEGKGGFPWDTHPHPLPLCDQMEDGFLRDHLLNPQLLLSLMQRWGT